MIYTKQIYNTIFYISVYNLKKENFRAVSYTFQGRITLGLFNVLYIDFTEPKL